MSANVFHLASNVMHKYSKSCVLIIGVTYILYKTTKIQAYFKYFINRLMPKANSFLIVSSLAEANYAAQQLRKRIRTKQFLGMDCEWVSVKGKRRPVALLQLSAPDGFCSLIRLCSLQTIPEDLAALLEDKNILKVGVAVVIDARYLLSDYGVHCEGCLDLRYLASSVGVEPGGLAYLAKHLLGEELDKDWRVRCSNWESEVLSSKQQHYAIKDATIAVEIFNSLNHKAISKKYSLWKRLSWNENEYWQNSYRLWLEYIGLNFKKSRSHPHNGNVDGEKWRVRKQKTESVIKRDYNTLLQKQHYSNVFLRAPDDQVLCTISDSRAAWYIEKGLVDIVQENPKTLRLKFEPSGRATEPDGYYTIPKDNICVVCGSDTDLRRKNVVPSEYRRYFEESLKTHHSHDVLLMCLRCHTLSFSHDQTLREQLVIECDAPFSEGKNSKLREVPEMKAVRSAARALFFFGEMIPPNRKAVLQQTILETLGISPNQLSKELLGDLIDIECSVESEDYVPHGLKVVEHYRTHKSIEALECRWRQHFLNNMKPRYLPHLWSVNYRRN